MKPGLKLTKRQILSLAESVQEDFSEMGDGTQFDVEPTNLHNGQTICLQSSMHRPAGHTKAIFINRRGQRQEMTG